MNEATAIIELRKDTTALKQLADLEEIVDVPPDQGGAYFSDGEREFIRKVRRQFDKALVFSAEQRGRISYLYCVYESASHHHAAAVALLDSEET